MSAPGEQRVSAPAHATGAVEFVALEDVAGDETFRLRPDGDVSELASSLGRLGQLAPVELRPWPGAASDGPRWQVVSGFRRLAAVRMLARERVLARLHRELSDDDAWALALAEALLHEPLTGAELEALRERLRQGALAPWAEDLVDDALVRAPVDAELRERFYAFLSGAEVEAADDGEASAEGEAPVESEAPADAEAPRESDAEAAPAEAEAVPEEPPAADAAARASLSPEEGKVGLAEASPEEQVTEDGGAAEIEVTPEELVADLVARLSELNQDLATAFEAWDDLPPEGREAVVEQARYVAALLPFLEGKGQG